MIFRASGRAIIALAAAISVVTTAFAVMSGSVRMPAPNPADAAKLLGRPSFSNGLPELPSGWQVATYEKSGTWAICVGKPWDVGVKSGDDSEFKTVAIRLAEQFAENLGMPNSSFRVESVTHPKGMTAVLVRPELEGTPVYQAYAVFSFNRDQKLISFKGEGFGSDRFGSFKIGSEEAVKRAIELFSAESKVTVVSSKEWWLPEYNEDGIQLRAVYEAVLAGNSPELRPAVFVDGLTGRVVAAENRVTYVNLPGVTHGMAHPRFRRDEEQDMVYPEEYVTLRGGAQMTSSVAGEFNFQVNAGAAPFNLSSELRGRWVDVNYDDGADASQQIRMNQVGEVNFNWTDENSRPDERMLFVHVNGIHAYWKSVDQNFNGMDWELPATCAFDNQYDNAFWNGAGIYFGEGAQMDNFAMYADIIQHEFTHGVTSNIYPWDVLPYTGESGAMNEAWSDYFPCSISDEPYMGEGGLVAMGGYIRLIDNELVYPKDWYGEVHVDSRMISAAMWHSREVLGKEVTDPLFHFAKFQLGNNFLSYFVDVMTTDDDDGDVSNGTPHDHELYEQFGRHGIGPGLRPKMAFGVESVRDDAVRGARGDENYQYEPGETIRIEMDLKRLGILFPPPAVRVQVRLTNDNPGLELVRDVVNFGNMQAGDSIMTPEPFLLRVKDDAVLSFANLHFVISCEGEANLGEKTVRIPVGRTQVLVVQDGEDRIDRMSWFRSALDTNRVIYCEYEMYQSDMNFEWRLAQFRTVVWFTGDSKTGILNEANRNLLSRFMNRGGNVLLTGQFIPKELNNSAFLEDYFGARVLSDSVNQYLLQGVAGDPVGRNLSILLLGSGGAMNQRHPATLEATNGVEIFNYPRLHGTPAGAVRYTIPASGAKTILFGFGLEGIGGHGGTNARAAVMAGVMEWFGEPTSAPRITDPVATNFAIDEAYPNPFNATITIGYSVAPNYLGEVRLGVYDLQGREVATLVNGGAVKAGAGKAVWNASDAPAGEYVVRFEAGDERSVRKIVLIK